MKMISVRQAAVMEGVTTKTIYDRLWSGRVPGAQKVDGIWRLPMLEELRPIDGKSAASGERE